MYKFSKRPGYIGDTEKDTSSSYSGYKFTERPVGFVETKIAKTEEEKRAEEFLKKSYIKQIFSKETVRQIPGAIAGFVPGLKEAFTEKQTKKQSFVSGYTSPFKFAKGIVDMSLNASAGAGLSLFEAVTGKPQYQELSFGGKVSSYQQQSKELEEAGFTSEESKVMVAINTYLGLLPVVDRVVKVNKIKNNIKKEIETKKTIEDIPPKKVYKIAKDVFKEEKVNFPELKREIDTIINRTKEKAAADKSIMDMPERIRTRNEITGFTDIKPRRGENILNLLREKPTRKIQDIKRIKIKEKLSDRGLDIMRGETKFYPETKTKVKPIEKIETIETYRVKRVIEAERKKIENSLLNEYEKGKEYKRIGFEMSTIRRHLERNPTIREVEVATNKLESIRTGKKVDYLGQEVEATGKVSFGKHEIKLKDGTTKFIPIKDIKTKDITRGDAIKYLREQAEIKLKGREDIFGLKTVKPKTQISKETIGEKKVSGVSKRIEAKAIEKEILDKEVEGKPLYSAGDKKIQSERIANLINTNLQLAKDAVAGRAPVPEGIRGESLFAVMSKYAEKTNDGQLMLDLINSPFARELSVAGSKLSMSNIIKRDSAISRMKEIVAVKESMSEGMLKGRKSRKVKNEIVENIEKEVSKSKVTKSQLNDLFDSIKC